MAEERPDESQNRHLYSMLDETAWFLVCASLPVPDLCAFSATCRTFHRLANDDLIWKALYSAAFPETTFLSTDDAAALVRSRLPYMSSGQTYTLRKPPELKAVEPALVVANPDAKKKKKMRALTPEEAACAKAKIDRYEQAWHDQEMTDAVRAVLYRCLGDPYAYAKAAADRPALANGAAYPLVTGVRSVFTQYNIGIYDLRWVQEGTLPEVPFGCWKLAYMDRVAMQDQMGDEDVKSQLNILTIKKKGRPFMAGDVCITAPVVVDASAKAGPWAWEAPVADTAEVLQQVPPDTTISLTNVDYEPAPYDAATRRALAKAWAEDGAAEHASIASFSRFSLQLMAVGAPPALLRGAHEAALQEITHAELCFGLASLYAGTEVRPGMLPVPPAAFECTGSLAALARSTAAEGCVEETLSAFVAVAQLAGARDPPVVAALQQIVRDEIAHAALAWKTVAWAVATNESAREAAAVAFQAAAPGTEGGGGQAFPPGSGRLDEEAGAAVRQWAFATCVRPWAEAVVSGRVPAAPLNTAGNSADGRALFEGASYMHQLAFGN